MLVRIHDAVRSVRAQAPARAVRRRSGARVLAAAAAAVVAMMLCAGAEAAEADIRSFSFACTTADGQIVKPRLGDIDGVTYTNLPAQRQQCLGTIDHKLALCRENTAFVSDRRNQELAACLPTFEEQAKACVVHFTFERGKCDTGRPGPDDDAARKQEEQTTQEGPPGNRYRVKPVDRLTVAIEAANVRAGPGPDHDIVGTVESGDRLRVTGEVGGRDWLRIDFPSVGAAYVYAPLLDEVRGAAREEEPTTAAPALSGPNWSLAENQACEVWNYGNRNYEPFTWSGVCVDGKASGEGLLLYRAGEGTYEGGMQAGKMHGRGILDWANGFRYEGELRDGKQHGYGTLTQASGDRYEGGWRDGRPHGHGTYVRADGSIYEGAWRDGCFGKRNGRWVTIGTTAAACDFE